MAYGLNLCPKSCSIRSYECILALETLVECRTSRFGSLVRGARS
ncbi:hypothetical protein ACU8KH_02241 [Lachancea thermotolerans]